jgi:hypothetical protein
MPTTRPRRAAPAPEIASLRQACVLLLNGIASATHKRSMWATTDDGGGVVFRGRIGSGSGFAAPGFAVTQLLWAFGVRGRFAARRAR